MPRINECVGYPGTVHNRSALAGLVVNLTCELVAIALHCTIFDNLRLRISEILIYIRECRGGGQVGVSCHTPSWAGCAIRHFDWP